MLRAAPRLDRAGDSHAADVVAAQVEQHDVLRALLLVAQQVRLQLGIFLGRAPPPPGARQRSGAVAAE